MFYLVAYGITTLAAFGIVSYLEGEEESGLDMDSYRGLARRNPYLAAGFALAMVSLAGFPPTVGFLGKYFVFTAAVEEGYIWLVVIAVLNSLVSVFYYLRPVVMMYMKAPVEEKPIPLTPLLIPVLLLLIIVVLGLGVYPELLVEGSGAAALALTRP
jgi:NADH-quinone oxidoreductase subunit N